ncbi:hypothetical protein IWQ52_001006 [Labrenzia sp. EL_159]|nr:hypothetical protein [Labrenzia sp. EL_162]MBG6193504.1 hypothetical protein [Labrenzia sp. EL_159]
MSADVSPHKHRRPGLIGGPIRGSAKQSHSRRDDRAVDPLPEEAFSENEWGPDQVVDDPGKNVEAAR